MITAQKCDACQDTGVFAPATPSCAIDAKRTGWIAVERCDACEKFADDLSAALSRFRVAGWFQCHYGGLHTLANARSRRQLRP